MISLLRSARAEGRRPRVHGNGFIQLDLNDAARMHLFGHPEIPAQKTYTGIHDHRFSFHSQVLLGCLRHTEYYVVSSRDRIEAPTHTVYSPVKNPDKMRSAQFAPVCEHVYAIALPTRYYRKGAFYRFEMREFHETAADGPTLTVMNKIATDMSHTVRILVPMSFEVPDLVHPAADEGLLWRLLEEAVRQI